MTTTLSAASLVSILSLGAIACGATGKTTNLGTDGNELSAGDGALCTESPIHILDCAAGEHPAITHRNRGVGSPEVHVISVYEGESTHYSDREHVRADATVQVTRKGHHILVLNAYEPIDFVVTAGQGAVIDRVVLAGYYKLTAKVPAGTEVINESAIDETGAERHFDLDLMLDCYEGEGCDRSRFEPAVTRLAGARPLAYASCYRATKFLVEDDSPECAGAPAAPLPPPLPGTSFERLAFQSDRSLSACQGGERYVRYDGKAQKWVGAELCSPTRYKLYLGETRDGVFHEIGDFAGHGQDHCELVNPAFTMPNEDDIKQGCPSCEVEMAGSERPGAVPVYSRANFGEAFTLGTWPEHNLYTSSWYECGVAIGDGHEAAAPPAGSGEKSDPR